MVAPNTERDTETMRRRIRRADASPRISRLVFEHGHWWLILRDGTTFDVVDASGPGSTDGFALERV